MRNIIKRIIKEQYYHYPYEKFFKESKDIILKKIIDKFGERFIKSLFNRLDKLYNISVEWDGSIKPYDILIINKEKQTETGIIEPTDYVMKIIGTGNYSDSVDFDDSIDIVSAWINTK